MNQIGYRINITIPHEHIPQKRTHVMLQDGKLTLMWLIESAERNKEYTPVSVGLTNGLIGERIFLIPKGKQHLYDSVKTLEDFREIKKVGAFGKNWYDSKVWEANSLKYTVVDGEWRQIYRFLKLEKVGVDYFSRGFTEIVTEAGQHPYLDIEQKLVFIYERDFIFYLSDNAKKYKPILEKALINAKETGLMDSLIQKYWKDDFEKLEYENRTKIFLKLPE